VDDEEKAQKYFRMAYANDFSVLTAGSVPEALDVLAQHGEEIAVLITDQRMPGQQGVDLLKRAREDWPEIVRILTTAYSDLDDAIAAVNRGEILRYVTKPWDIQALKVELRHAMDFFLLRRERDLLLSEKLSVRHRMAQSDRLVSLLAIAEGLVHLRHAPYAIAAWARDSCVDESAGPPAMADLELWGLEVFSPVLPHLGGRAMADLELWGLEVREASSLMQTHRALHALDESVQAGFPDRADLAELLRSAGLAVEGNAGEIAMRRDLIAAMIDVLAKQTANPTTARWAWESEGNGTSILRVTGAGAISDRRSGGSSSGYASAGLLPAYLIAWHHGGTLQATAAEGKSGFELTLPKQPDAVVFPEPDENTLAGFFSMLENWE